MEIWDVYDKNRKFTGRTMTRGESINIGDFHLVVHIWVINSQGEILIQKRADNLDRHPGIWASTGGSAIAGENSLNAAKRELEEELGLIVDIDSNNKIMSFSKTDSHTDVYLVNSNILIDELKLQVEEVSEAKWVNISSLRELINNEAFYHHGKKYMNQVFYYSYNKYSFKNEMIKTSRLKIIPCNYEMLNDLYHSSQELDELFGFKVLEQEYKKLKKIVPVFKNLMKNNTENYKWFVWLIVEAETHTIIGDIGFKGVPNEKKQVEIGYGIDPTSQKNGYATEATEAMLKWAFRSSEIDSVIACCKEDNYGSIRVLERNNMVHDGIHNNLVNWYKIR